MLDASVAAMASGLTEKGAQSGTDYFVSDNNFVQGRVYMRSMFRYESWILLLCLTPYILITLVMVAQGTEALTHHVS